MAKKASKKKVNRKLRRAVRKTLSAIFMATALVVAAIPVQDGVLASSVDTDPNDPAISTTPTEEPYEDPYDVTDSDDSTGMSVARPTSAEEKGYAIDWDTQVFKISEAYKVASSGSTYVITGFNADYKPVTDSGLTISSFVVTGYYLEDIEDTEKAIEAMYLDANSNYISGSADDIASYFNQYAQLAGVDVNTVDNGYYSGYAVEDTEFRTDAEGNLVEVPLGTYHIDFYKNQSVDPNNVPGGSSFPISTLYRYAEKVYAVKNGGGNRSQDFGWQLEQVAEVQDDGSLEYYYAYRNKELGAQWAAIMEADQAPDNIPGVFTDANGFKTKENLYVSAIADKAFVKGTDGGMYSTSGADNNPTYVTRIVLPKSISRIGNSAFEGLSSLKSVVLNGKTQIGNRAFSSCRSLTDIEMVGVQTIGTEAFKDCVSLKTMVFPSSETTTIEPGAFAGCTGLTTVDMSDITQSLEIKRYAFYNCTSLSEIKFSPNTSLIGEGAFALHPDNQGGTLKEMDFSVINIANFNFGDPNTTRTAADNGEMMLAGRGNLLKCTLPSTYGSSTAVTLPKDFFKNCYLLESVKVSGAYVSLPVPTDPDDTAFEGNAFKNVKTVRNGLYIEGLSTMSPGQDIMAEGNFSNTRRTAHVLGLDYKFTETTGNYVGAYFEAAQVEQDEITQEEIMDYYMIQLNGGDPDAKEGVISRYFPQRETKGDETSPIVGGKNLVIRPTYGDGIRVTAITDGCFDLVSNRAETLTIGDGTISSIDANAFENFTALKAVDLGNSVTSIGNAAFKGCDQLEDVTFRTQDNVSIGTESFAKNYEAASGGITFHGKIAPDFTPFAWAMTPSNDLSSSGTRVLYENLFPTYVGALYDRGSSSTDNQVVTMVYYPIYASLDQDNQAYIAERMEALKEKYPDMPGYDYSIINRVENPSLPDWQTADPNDVSLAQATRNIVIPAGVTSIDTKAFYDTYLTENIASITAYWTAGEIRAASVDQRQMTSRAAVRYASTNVVTSDVVVGTTVSGNGAAVVTKEVESVPGLFSGYYEDYLDSDPDKAIYETNPNGNDRVETITMSTVTSLPDYAFDSCERLNTVDLGAVQEFGIAPFRGCTRIANVTATGNDAIVVENGIIYKSNGDGSYELIECLPTRGSNGTLQEVSVANDPKLANVSSINEEAFTGCSYILAADFTGCNGIRTIPENCFEGCISLRRVTLPSSIRLIEAGAFADLDPIEVTIPAKEVMIDKTAFKHGPDSNGNILSTVVIRSYSDSAVEEYAGTNKITFVAYDENLHFVQFLDDNFNVLYSTYVEHGRSIEDWLDQQEIPTSAQQEDAKFTGWRSITSGASLRSIEMDATFVAVFDYGSNSNPNDPNNPYDPNDPNNPYDPNDPNNPYDPNDPNNPLNPTDPNAPGNSDDEDKDKDKDKDENGNTLYTVTVINGSGSGSYVEGATVVITANNPPTGQKFKEWTVESNNVTLASTRVTATTFEMPAANVQVTANYEKDNSSSSSSSGSSVSGNSSNSSNASSRNNGTKVVITKPGISDTDLAAATVNGSNNDFIVKISETAEATAAVEQALINRFGSLDNVRYVAMDISLYDSTGTTKITDTTGYTIDITIPLPDALRDYAGNNKTAAVVNSQLEDLTPKFTTIDGVPCVTFRATHFSPYTVYVDTTNLSAGGLDSTPKTGDGIHPKWFLVMGLACLSVVLFMKKDKKVPRVKTA